MKRRKLNQSPDLDPEVVPDLDPEVVPDRDCKVFSKSWWWLSLIQGSAAIIAIECKIVTDIIL